MGFSIVEHEDTPTEVGPAVGVKPVAGRGLRLPLAAPVVDEAAAAQAARQAVEQWVDQQTLDAMLARVKGDGLRLTGPGGFLGELVKAVLERGLAAELAEHLGYAKRDPVPTPSKVSTTRSARSSRIGDTSPPTTP